MYPVQLHLTPGEHPRSMPSPQDVTRICALARTTFPALEHIRIRVGGERILLTMFIAADSSTGAARLALDIARHIVATEPAVRGWRCAWGEPT